MNPKLPFSMDPEYQAAQRAYMRYHNMNPIFGISSKYVCHDVSLCFLMIDLYLVWLGIGIKCFNRISVV